jgi:hypothetical protein
VIICSQALPIKGFPGFSFYERAFTPFTRYYLFSGVVHTIAQDKSATATVDGIPFQSSVLVISNYAVLVSWTARREGGGP